MMVQEIRKWRIQKKNKKKKIVTSQSKDAKKNYDFFIFFLANN